MPVSDLIVDRLWPTLLLVGTATVLATSSASGSACVSAWNRGEAIDRVATGRTLTLYSMPEWWLGLMLIAVFAVGVGPLPGIFPTGGLHSVDVDPWTARALARHRAGTWRCRCSR